MAQEKAKPAPKPESRQKRTVPGTWKRDDFIKGKETAFNEALLGISIAIRHAPAAMKAA